MYNKWIWTFGLHTKWSGHYVVINGDEMAGRLYVFHKYGQENMAFDYPYENAMTNVVRKYNLKLLEEVNV